MLAPKWLQIVAGLAILNATLVATSLVHRHLIAVEPSQQLNNSASEVQSVTPEQSKSLLLEKLQNEAPSVLHSQPLPVADDDPLMAEIRKQVSERFSDLSVSSEPITETTDTGSQTPISDASTDQRQTRLSTIGQLSSAAQSLLKMADVLRSSGRTAEADKAVQQAEQLQATIRQLAQ